jgi:hypothetical protein
MARRISSVLPSKMFFPMYMIGYRERYDDEEKNE